MFEREIFQKVKLAIEERRATAINTAEEHNLEVRARSEEIAAIDAELTKTGLLLFRTACSGGDITPVRERNLALQKKRREALLTLGLPEDYTEPQFVCKECNDTGYAGTSMCACFREMLVMENLKASGIGNLVDRQSFDNFNLDRYKSKSNEAYEQMKRNLAFARSYADNFAKKRGNLLLIGTTGTGKTHLSTAIAKSVIEQGFTVLYDSAQNIVAAYENDRFHSGYGEYAPVSEKYTECDLLIIDDLGTEFSNAFTVSCLYNLFNTRQNRGLSTVISTNLSPKELTTRYEDRIYSRIIGHDYQILHFVGDDYRLMR